MKNKIAHIVDFFYFPFLHFIPLQTFRYAMVGGANVLYGMVQYWLLFNFVLGQRDTDFGIVVISAPILAFLINFAITFFTGFWLTRNIAFGGGSSLKGRVQMFRYAQVVGLNVAINYFGLKFLVESCAFYPSIANALLQVVTVLVSYLAARYYTFR